MINLNFRIFNHEGVIIPIKIEKGVMPTPLSYNDPIAQFHYHPSKKGLMWTFNEKEIIIKDDNYDVNGTPSVDFKYILTIYSEEVNDVYSISNNKVKMTVKSIVYNLDGSIHKTLEIPALKSPLAIKRLDFLKENNPPVINIKYPGGFEFTWIGWKKLENEEIVDSIGIIFDRELWEDRVLNPEIGEIGDLIHYGKN